MASLVGAILFLLPIILPISHFPFTTSRFPLPIFHSPFSTPHFPLPIFHFPGCYPMLPHCLPCRVSCGAVTLPLKASFAIRHLPPARQQPHSAKIRRWRRQSVQMGRKICVCLSSSPRWQQVGGAHLYISRCCERPHAAAAS